jgi:V/A-type H+-transporting ATPase subunit C
VKQLAVGDEKNRHLPLATRDSIMVKYPASYARMRGLKGKLLGREQLEDFLGASDTESIISALTGTVYAQHLRDITDLPRIEHGLKQDLVLSYIKLLTFLRGRSARFISALLGKFELLNLKSIIRSLARTSDEEDSVEPYIFPLGKYHTIPIEAALETDDLEDCIALMSKTPFARPLEIGYRQYEEEGRLFLLELALDLDYYDRLWKAMDDLGSVDKLNAARLLGIQYDTSNIVWILRFREYYDLSPEQIFQYIIPHGWKIRGKLFWEVAAENDVTEAIVKRQVSPYDEILGSVDRVDGSLILGVELSLLRYRYRESLEMFMKFPLQSSQLIAFFTCKEMEIRDIITVLSGRQLDLTQERIRSYMVTLRE